MKKLLIFLPVMFIVTLVFPNNVSLFSRYQQVQKEINLAMFTKNDYSYTAYNDANASVEVIVSKVNNNKVTVLNRKTFAALQLKQYPAAGQAISNHVKINGSLKSSDMLMVTYIITYNTNGSLLKYQKSELVSKETTKDNINITI
jgi:hypothetical protein